MIKLMFSTGGIAFENLSSGVNHVLLQVQDFVNELEEKGEELHKPARKTLVDINGKTVGTVMVILGKRPRR